MEQITPVIAFWRDVVGPERWFEPIEAPGCAALDREMRLRFERLWRKARIGALDDWMARPEGCLALILVLDQFSRRMFRGGPEAWVTDEQALAVADRTIAQGHDLRIAQPLRQFLYMPLLHAETLECQTRGLTLLAERAPDGQLADARARHMVIRRFGHFPWRNALQGRASSHEETAFLWAGGYDRALRRQVTQTPVDAVGELV